MNRSKKSSLLYLAIFIGVIALLILACGSSTTDELREVSPTEGVAEPAGDAERAPEATEVPTEESEPSSPTEAPEPTTVPTDTPVPPTPTPEPEAIEVIDFGFGQDGRSAGYAFVVENPNDSFAFTDSRYQVAAFDDAGAIVDTDSGSLAVILPGQTIGIGGDIFLEEGVTVTSIEVQFNAGDPEASETLPTFSVENATYIADNYFPSATGLVTSPYLRTFENLRVSAIAYNETDEIIGSGYTYLSFVLAESSTGVDVSLTTNADAVSRVEIYPALSTLSLFAGESEIPEDGEALVLQKFGFGQDGGSAGYGLIVENPNSGFALERSQYRVTALNAEGEVIDTDEGYISLLLPGETLGIGGDLFVDSSIQMASILVQVLEGDYEDSAPIPPFTAENVTFQPGSFSSSVSGFIVSSFSSDISDVRVYALAYDADGNIVGGGYTFADFISANSRTAVEVSVTVAGTPTAVELYATLSGLSEIE